MPYGNVSILLFSTVKVIYYLRHDCHCMWNWSTKDQLRWNKSLCHDKCIFVEGDYGNGDVLLFNVEDMQANVSWVKYT